MKALRYFLLLGALMVPLALMSTPAANAQIGVGIGYGAVWRLRLRVSRSGLFLGLLQLLSLRLRALWLLRTELVRRRPLYRRGALV